MVRHLELTRTRTDRAAGFTLVELMVVVAIVGIVGALAARMYSKGARGETAPAFARNLMSTMLDARHLAVTLGQPVSVTLNGAGSPSPMTVWTAAYDPTTTTWKRQSTLALPTSVVLCTPANTVTLGTIASPVCPLSGTNTLCFYPNGRADLPPSGACDTTSRTSGSGATLYLTTNDNNQYAKKYQLPIWGLTGMTKLVDQW